MLSEIHRDRLSLDFVVNDYFPFMLIIIYKLTKSQNIQNNVINYNNTILVKTDQLVRSQKLKKTGKIVDRIVIGIGSFRIF